MRLLTGQDYKKRIGENIAKRRIDAGWSLRQFALVAEVDYAHLSRIESGQGNPTIDTLDKICAAFDIEIKDLLP